MKKAFILTFVFALISFATAWSQTETQPVKEAKPAKDKTEQIKNAEEKSDGAAFSGKGKGGDKDMVEKEKSKVKTKGKVKKSKKGKKGKKKSDDGDVKEKGEKTRKEGDKNKEKPDAGTGAPEQPDQKRPESNTKPAGKKPVEAKPKMKENGGKR